MSIEYRVLKNGVVVEENIVSPHNLLFSDIDVNVNFQIERINNNVVVGRSNIVNVSPQFEILQFDVEKRVDNNIPVILKITDTENVPMTIVIVATKDVNFQPTATNILEENNFDIFLTTVVTEDTTITIPITSEGTGVYNFFAMAINSNNVKTPIKEIRNYNLISYEDSTIFEDTFSYETETPLRLTGDWRVVKSSPAYESDFVATGGEAWIKNTTPYLRSISLAATKEIPNNQFVEFSISTLPSSGLQFFLLRATDQDNGYAMYFVSSGSLSVIRLVEGERQQITSSIPMKLQSRYRLEAFNDTFNFYEDGVLLNTFTDNVYTEGFAGFNITDNGSKGFPSPIISYFSCGGVFNG